MHQVSSQFTIESFSKAIDFNTQTRSSRYFLPFLSQLRNVFLEYDRESLSNLMDALSLLRTLPSFYTHRDDWINHALSWMDLLSLEVTLSINPPIYLPYELNPSSLNSFGINVSHCRHGCQSIYELERHYRFLVWLRLITTLCFSEWLIPGAPSI